MLFDDTVFSIQQCIVKYRTTLSFPAYYQGIQVRCSANTRLRLYCEIATASCENNVPKVLIGAGLEEKRIELLVFKATKCKEDQQLQFATVYPCCLCSTHDNISGNVSEASASSFVNQEACFGAYSTS